MDNNNQGNIYTMAQTPPPVQVYNQPSLEPAKKRSKAKIIIIIAAAAVLIAAIALVLVFFVFAPASGGTAQAVKSPTPFFYIEDETAYVAVGSRTMEMEGADIIDSDSYSSQINCMLSFDNRYVLYLADKDEETGAGSLMRMDLKTGSAPVLVAEDVCAARMSAYGNYVMYLRDVEEGMGTLYYGEAGKEATEAADEVSTETYGMSPNGKSYYYYDVSDEDGAVVLYASVNGSEPEKVKEAGPDESIWIVLMTDSGKLIYQYTEYDEDQYESESTLYVFKNGDEEKIASEAYLQMIFDTDADKILYSEEDVLYYEEQGEDKERISKEYITAIYKPYYGSDASHVPDEHFLLIESDGKDDSYPQEITMYEMRIGSDPVKITKADSWSFAMNPDFTWVSFMRDGELYLSYKDKDEWSDRISLCDSSVQPWFDMQGKYFYYIETSDSGDSYGDLYRYSLSPKTEDPELLLYDVEAFLLGDGVVYARTTDDEIYNVVSKDNKTLLFDEETLGWSLAPDGLYVYTEAKQYDVYFVPSNGDEPETLCYDAESIEYQGYAIIYNYVPKVSEDLADKLSEVYEDALYFQDIINGTNDANIGSPFRYYNESIELLDQLLSTVDSGDEVYELIDSFYQGYLSIETYAYAGIGSTEAEDAKEEINYYFEQAFDLFGSIIGESTIGDYAQTAPAESN